MKTFIKGQQYFLETSVIDSDGDFVLGLTVGYDVRNSDTNVSIQSGNLTEEGNIYKIAITINTVAQYRVFYTTPDGYENGQDTIIVEEAIEDRVWNELVLGHSTAGSFAELFNRVAGLCQENYRIFNPTYSLVNEQYVMNSATIKIYSSPADCNSDTNPLATYTITATFDANANMSGYKVIKA